MRWVLAEHDAGAAALLAERAGVHPLIARILAVRGITEPGKAQAFLSSDLSSLSDPSVFIGMAAAIVRILGAAATGQRVIVYGDYDVDGVSGSAILWLALKDLGADAVSYIPDRITEGYGLNDQALRKIEATGARVVITVDCGISAVREARTARDLGIDLIITDHHEFDGSVPEAFAVLHPSLLQPDVAAEQQERIAGLTGAGMAFKLVQGLLGAEAGDARMARFLDLVTLGTIADMGRVTGENRILVKHGLELLSAGNGSVRPGIAALKEVAGLSGRRVTAGTVGFTLAPRINASGRLASADAAFRLLTTTDPDEARALAADLDTVNRERQALEERIWSAARERCLEAGDLSGTGAFVLASEDWHPGVIGIVASRIVDEFYRPTALISLKEGVGKGSARSIPGFDLYAGLLQCSDLLMGFGGHKCAAGMTVSADRIPQFRDRLSKLVLDHFGADGFVRTLKVDASVSLDELNFDLLAELEKIAPFGQGNPEPRLGIKGLEVLSVRHVGGNKHVKMRLRQQNGRSVDAIAYNRGEAFAGRLRQGNRIAAVFVPRCNTWNGNAAIELEIKDIKLER